MSTNRHERDFQEISDASISFVIGSGKLKRNGKTLDKNENDKYKNGNFYVSIKTGDVFVCSSRSVSYNNNHMRWNESLHMPVRLYSEPSHRENALIVFLHYVNAEGNPVEWYTVLHLHDLILRESLVHKLELFQWKETEEPATIAYIKVKISLAYGIYGYGQGLVVHVDDSELPPVEDIGGKHYKTMFPVSDPYQFNDQPKTTEFVESLMDALVQRVGGSLKELYNRANDMNIKSGDFILKNRQNTDPSDPTNANFSAESEDDVISVNVIGLDTDPPQSRETEKQEEEYEYDNSE